MMAPSCYGDRQLCYSLHFFMVIRSCATCCTPCHDDPQLCYSLHSVPRNRPCMGMALVLSWPINLLCTLAFYHVLLLQIEGSSAVPAHYVKKTSMRSCRGKRASSPGSHLRSMRHFRHISRCARHRTTKRTLLRSSRRDDRSGVR